MFSINNDWLKKIYIPIIYIFLAIALPANSAFAAPLRQSTDIYQKTPHKSISSNLEEPQQDKSLVPTIGEELINDPSFENSFNYYGYWGQYSQNFGSPLCTVAICGNGGGTAGPRTGSVWAWFGGTNLSEYSLLWQLPTIPGCEATLEFYLWIGANGEGSNAGDFFAVEIGGNRVFMADGSWIDYGYSQYKLVSIDVSAYADNNLHHIDFISITSDQVVNFNVDDVSLKSTGCKVSGNAGSSGIQLSYTNGTPKTATSDANGNYSFIVPANWSGTVTPSHACYTFSPASRSYSNISTTQSNQNYTPTFTAVNGCASTNITIGGVNRGTYGIAPGSSQRVNYAGLDAGPVVVDATNDTPIIAALRDAYFVNGNVESFVQLMGLPEAALSTKYYFPAYNNVTLDGQLRFGNVGNASTTVTVTIAGVVRGTYNLAPGQAQRVNYTGLDAGPVIVESSGGVPIIAALRDAYFVNGQIESFAQLMGLPASQLSDTYYFPAYNNVSLNGQLRIGNVDTVSTTVTVTIAGVVRGTYPLAPDQAVRINYAGLDAGPVVVQSSGGAKIIAALRDAYYVSGQITSFVQLMGLPFNQLSTKYYFPAYNNVSLDGQLRFGNVGNASTTVTVTIAGVVRGTYNLNPGEAKRVNYAGLDAGPVIVESSGGVPIIAALRDAYFVNGQIESFAQLMGLPDTALSPTYYFPAYNNVSLNGQLRFGVP